jgi:hypothetical protein
MDSSGKIIPERRICGSASMMASWIACPWFCETLETRTPSPRVTNRNRSAPTTNVPTDPRNGTSKSHTPTPTTRARSIEATRK